MARTPSSPPDIATLTLLVKMLELQNNIMSPSVLGEGAYIDAMHDLLKGKGIVGATSRNQTMKIIGRPFNKDGQDAEGITVSMLADVARLVLQDLLSENQLSQMKPGTEWAYFSEYISNPPTECIVLNKYNYYKYLPSESERKTINSFVMTKLGEWGIDKDIDHFLIYAWSGVENVVKNAVLQINKRTNEIVHTYFTKGLDSMVPTMRFYSDGTIDNMIHTSHLSIFNLSNSSNSSGYSRVSIYLRASDIELYTLPQVRGIMVLSSYTGTFPVSYEIIVQKRDNFKDAITEVEKESPRNEYIFELINKRRELVTDSTPGELSSKNIFPMVQKLQGYYRIGYVGSTEPSRNRALVVGNAYISAAGIVMVKMGHTPLLTSYIDNEVYYGEDLLCIKPLLKSQKDSFKLTYSLKVVYDYSKLTPVVKSLIGKSSGFRDTVVLGGEVLFIKINDANFEDFEKMNEKLEPLLIKHQGMNVEGLKDREVSLLFEYFKDQINPADPT